LKIRVITVNEKSLSSSLIATQSLYVFKCHLLSKEPYLVLLEDMEYLSDSISISDTVLVDPSVKHFIYNGSNTQLFRNLLPVVEKTGSLYKSMKTVGLTDSNILKGGQYAKSRIKITDNRTDNCGKQFADKWNFTNGCKEG